MVSLNPFNRKEKEDELDPARQAAVVNAVTPFMNQQNASDTQTDRELGVDKLLLEDEDLIKFVEKLCQETVTDYVLVPMPIKNPDGSIAMQQEIALDNTGKPVIVNNLPVLINKPAYIMQPTTRQRIINRPWAYALRAYLSSIFPGRSIDPFDVDTYKLQTRCDFADMIDEMPPDDFHDYSKFVMVLERAVETAFDDTKSDGKIGRKAGLLKVKRGELSVGMHRGPPNPQGGKQQ